MIINRQAQINQSKRFIYAYKNETVIATIQDYEIIINEGSQGEKIISEQSDTFDLSLIQSGDLYEGAETSLEVNPILNARRNDDGKLEVDVLYWIEEDASESDRFPELIEV